MRNLAWLKWVILTVIIAGGAWFLTRGGAVPITQAELDKFAQCVASKGATMYSAYWCLHCQNEKKAFGESFKYINYVECTQEVQKCKDAKIAGYPVWIFSDGKRLEGEQGLAGLSKETGCVLPNSSPIPTPTPFPQ